MDKEKNFRGTVFFKQAGLMLRAMVPLGTEPCFAVKGGTAINLFLRDMPRLSVDIDLTYLPFESRDSTLSHISDALKRSARKIEKSIPGSTVSKTTVQQTTQISKLVVQNQGVKIKIEPNTILRGAVHPPEVHDISKRAEDLFGLFVSATTLSLPDLYGGKICAALDRQHPRDLFDIKVLLENEGITQDIRRAFVVYLASHDRPMIELLDPTPLNTREIFKNEFVGMTTFPVEYEELQSALKTLVSTLRKDLSQTERKFLVSLKEGTPDWTVLGIPDLDRFPAIQWKLRNIQKMDKKKHTESLRRLKQKLDI